MKKWLLAVLAVGFGLAAVPASTWWIGRQFDSELANHYQLVEDSPFLKVVARDYRRDFYRATDTATYELGDALRGLLPDGAERRSAPIRFTVTTVAEFGPYVAGRFAATIATTEVTLESTDAISLAATDALMSMRAEIGLSGIGTATFTAAANTLTFAATDDAAPRLAWATFTGSTQFDRGFKTVRVRGDVSKLTLETAEGARIVASALAFESNERRLYDDGPLRTGTQRANIGTIEITQGDEQTPLKLEEIAYSVDTPAVGDFIDAAMKLSARSVRVGSAEYGPARYDVAAKRLHARTAARLYGAMVEFSAAHRTNSDRQPAAAFDALGEILAELIVHRPELVLEHIGFNTALGEVKLAGRVVPGAITRADFTDPFALANKINADLELSIPEPLVATFAGGGGSQLIAAQLSAFIEQGYIVRAGGLLQAKLRYTEGQLTLNGKPVGRPGG